MGSEERTEDDAASKATSARPAGNGSEANAATNMTNLPYDEMDKLTPCRVCGSRRFWFDSDVWQCWKCVPPPSPDMIRVDLNERVN